MSKVVSSDLKATIESAHCWKETASYIAMFTPLACSTCYRTNCSEVEVTVAELRRPERILLFRHASQRLCLFDVLVFAAVLYHRNRS